eukprot:gene19059-biopygen23686
MRGLGILCGLPSGSSLPCRSPLGFGVAEARGALCFHGATARTTVVIANLWLACGAEAACEGLRVSTTGICIRPSACAYEKACYKLNLRGCSSVRVTDGAADLICSAGDACNGAVIPLGDCPPYAQCAIICSAMRACERLKVRTDGTCVRPPACVHGYACSALDLRGCRTVLTPGNTLGPNCSGEGACRNAILPLGTCHHARCALTCDGAQACQGLVVWTNGTCVRPSACRSSFACRCLNMQGCAAVQAPDGATDFLCNALSACQNAEIPLGPCTPSSPCRLKCEQDHACSGLKVSTNGICMRPVDCLDYAVCAWLDLHRCGIVLTPQEQAPEMNCAAKFACKGAVIPQGKCSEINPCVLHCTAEGACEGLKVSTTGTCIRPGECLHHSACAGLDLRGCGGVRAPSSAPGLRCGGASGCAAAAIPLGVCPRALPCALTCDAERACDGLNVSTSGSVSAAKRKRRPSASAATAKRSQAQAHQAQTHTKRSASASAARAKRSQAQAQPKRRTPKRKRKRTVLEPSANRAQAQPKRRPTPAQAQAQAQPRPSAAQAQAQAQLFLAGVGQAQAPSSPSTSALCLGQAQAKRKRTPSAGPPKRKRSASAAQGPSAAKRKRRPSAGPTKRKRSASAAQRPSAAKRKRSPSAGPPS